VTARPRGTIAAISELAVWRFAGGLLAPASSVWTPAIYAHARQLDAFAKDGMPAMMRGMMR
jgi:hypothetical protein